MKIKKIMSVMLIIILVISFSIEPVFAFHNGEYHGGYKYNTDHTLDFNMKIYIGDTYESFGMENIPGLRFNPGDFYWVCNPNLLQYGLFLNWVYTPKLEGNTHYSHGLWSNYYTGEYEYLTVNFDITVIRR